MSSFRAQVLSELRGIAVQCGPSFWGFVVWSVLVFILRISGGAVAAITAHTDDILGCGEPDLFLKSRRFLEIRFGQLKVQESPSYAWAWNRPRRRLSLRRGPGGALRFPSHPSGAVGRPEGFLGDGLYRIAPAFVGSVAWGRSGLSTRYLCLSAANCLEDQGALRE